jgi:hypothetical protein
MHPLSQSRSVVLDAKQHSAGAVDQHAAQIDVAAFTDAEQLRFAPSGVLPRHKANPLRKITLAVQMPPRCRWLPAWRWRSAAQSRESSGDADSAHLRY